jgi:hypothetical protein
MESTERRMALMTLSSEQLAEFLHLPPDTVFTGVQADIANYGTITFRIEHPDLKPVPLGNCLSRVAPRLKYVPAVPERVEFVGWGQ